MAYDVILGTTTRGDWTMGAGGTPARSLAYHAEMQRRDKVLALAKLVENEIKGNSSIAAVRSRAGTMAPGDETRWKAFEAAWISWQSRNINDKTPTSPQTIADLERWRIENTDWSRALTTAVPLPASKVPAHVRNLTRPTSVAVVTTPTKERSAAPVVVGLSGLALIIFSLTGKR